ncbi:MAG: aspartate--tRNA(Asn) ligase [Candidatus Uhrbacteria bacterium]
MERTNIGSTIDHIGGEVEISGAIEARRDMGKIVFLDVRDRTGLLQVVVVPQVIGEEQMELLKELRQGFVLHIHGLVKERGEKAVNPKLATGRIELEARKIDMLSRAAPFPFDVNGELAIDTYLDHLPLTLRTDRARAVFRIQAEIVEVFRAYLRGEGFVEFQCPKIVGGSTEGGANVFTIDYFGKEAFLAQSPQFYKQIMVGVFERVFTVGNVYRAELHATSRHVNEYTSLDLEFGYIEDHRDVMRIENDFLAYLVERLEKTCAAEFQLLGATLPTVPKDIPFLTLREAQEVLEKEYSLACVGEPDLDPEHERKLCEWSLKKHESDFLFVTHYPTSKRPLYTMPDPNDPEVTLSFDLLFRGVEVTTGGQRIHDYEQLKANVVKWGLNPDHFSYYLEAFKYGMPPEGGLAIGLERLTAKLLGIDNVKLATLFPRDINRIDDRLTKEE